MSGNFECIGEVVPTYEICNQIDDNCNGSIDEGLPITEDNLVGDFLYCFDRSGSMGIEIDAVKTATESFSQQFRDDPRYKFGIEDATAASPGITLTQNLTDFNTFQAKLNDIRANGSGLESIPEAIWKACDTTNPLMINWTPGVRRSLFVFTDEPAQVNQNIWLTEADIINACIDTETRVFIWSNNPGDYESLATFTGGLHFDLINDAEILEDDLNNILILSCQSP